MVLISNHFYNKQVYRQEVKKKYRYKYLFWDIRVISRFLEVHYWTSCIIVIAWQFNAEYTIWGGLLLGYIAIVIGRLLMR